MQVRLRPPRERESVETKKENVTITTDNKNGKSSHEENSRTAMDLASHIWPTRDVRHCKESVSGAVDTSKVDAILAAAKVSQRTEKRGGPVVKGADQAPALQVQYSATIEEVQTWLQDISTRKVNGGPL